MGPQRRQVKDDDEKVETEKFVEETYKWFQQAKPNRLTTRVKQEEFKKFKSDLIYWCQELFSFPTESAPVALEKLLKEGVLTIDVAKKWTQPSKASTTSPKSDHTSESKTKTKGSIFSTSYFFFFIIFFCFLLYFTNKAKYYDDLICLMEPKKNLDSAMKKLISIEEKNIVMGSEKNQFSFQSLLRAFAEELVFDWTRDLEQSDPPRHAISLRVQGSSSSIIERVIIDSFLKNWFSSSCFQSNLLILDTDTVRQGELRRTVDSFLLKCKEVNKFSLCLVVIKGCKTPNANKLVMSLKDYIYEEYIQIENKNIPSKGLGFIFLGGSLSNDKCMTEDIIDHDHPMGWDLNMIGRLRHKTRICNKY